MLGALISLIIAAIATVCGTAVPVVGAPVFAIAIGAVIASVWHVPPSVQPGITWCSKTLLQWSIVLLGANLSVAEITSGGARTLPLMLVTFAVVLALAFFVGRLLGLERDLRRLLGVGTAICGGSAIAAVSSVIDADQADISYALGAVFLFNVIAVVVFPPLGHAMHLSQYAFGVWAGTAINDTSSVVAAAFSYGHLAGTTGVIVKLTRTLLIVPLVLFYAWRRASVLRAQSKRIPWMSILPWFIVWFIVAAALNSLHVLPNAIASLLHQAALFSIVVALAAVGLSTDVARIRAAGVRPLLLGAVLWIAITVASLAVARLLGLDQA